MKTTTKILGLLLVASSFLFTGCNDDEEDYDSEKASIEDQKIGWEKIQGKVWKIELSYTSMDVDFDGDGKTDRDFFKTWSECEKDDIWIFNADGTFSINESDIACSGNTVYKNKTEGTWEIEHGGYAIFMLGGNSKPHSRLTLTDGESSYDVIIAVSGESYSGNYTVSGFYMEEERKVGDLNIKVVYTFVRG